MGKPAQQLAIVIVDDELIILMSLKAELKAHYGDAFVYENARSAEEGLKVVAALRERGVRIAAILSDWLMPGMKGDEFARAVRERFQSIPVILVTGYAENGAIASALSEGIIRAYVSKPWRGEEIFAMIDGLADEPAP